MKIAVIVYNGMSAFEFTGLHANLSAPLSRLDPGGPAWDFCAYSTPVTADSGLALVPTRIQQPLSAYDLLLVPGGAGSRELAQDAGFINWLQSAREAPVKASSGSGSLLLAAAGFLPQDAYPASSQASDFLLLAGQPGASARAFSSAAALGQYLAERISGFEILGETGPTQPRTAQVERITNETQIRISLRLDGSGRHAIDTGIGFLDHMLTHVAVHGLFDLQVQAAGDLHIDLHHTVEDVAISLGQAFNQALGDRAGIARMSHAYAPMDETLAFVALDFSGRPYAAIQADWHSPAVGSIPTTLFPHFFESFAVAARCNLHARLLAGRDDHHQAEALFKAFARALDAAVCLDPRRVKDGAAAVPSTKGTLTT